MGFSSPPKDNTVNWTGDLSPIGTDDFMIEFVGGFNHSNTSAYSTFRTGIKSLGSLDGILLDNPEPGANKLYFIYFPISLDGSYSRNQIFIEKSKPIGKPFHVIIGRSGVNAWAVVDGVKYSVTQDRVLEIANSLTISNASCFTQLRKFNFADEVYAQGLWNGGRWWDNSIEQKYRINNANLGNQIIINANSPSSKPFVKMEKSDNMNGWITPYTLGIGADDIDISNYGVFKPDRKSVV